MRTNTRVEFGLYDVTARGDSSPVCDTAQPFCRLRRDLLVEAVPSQVKYGTLESRQWLMDGSFSFFPEVPEADFWGLWSAVQSGESGAFAAPPVLDIQFSQAHSSTIIFPTVATTEYTSRICSSSATLMPMSPQKP